ncbi:MAG: hypothetical protein OJF50_000526 [Nitrospira sp.]|nr:hypothetical protein [Nitrospira sp.]
MITKHADTEQAILDMLHRYEVMTMDEILTVGQPDLTWNQVFLAIDRLSRQNLIVLHRVGLSYHVCLMNQEWLPGQEQHHIINSTVQYR